MSKSRGYPALPSAGSHSDGDDYAACGGASPDTVARLFAPANARRSYYVCGVRVDDVTQSEALSSIASLVEQPGFDRVVTPNVDHIVRAQRDQMFRSALNSSALSLPDGRWLRRGSRLQGIRFQEAITGRKLVDPLCRMAASRAWRIYLLGSRGSTAARAADVLLQRHPGLQIAGAHSPSDDFGHSETESADILAELDRVRPDILLLAVGAPKSETWMMRHASSIPAKVGIAVGCALDVIAGTFPECPDWATRAGFEWAHRLRHEPRRLWRRYLLRDPYFFYLLLKSRPESL